MLRGLRVEHIRSRTADRRDQGEHLVYMHYYCSLCGQNGFDDGVRLRSLTPRSVEPFLGDANAVTFDSEEWLPLPGMRS